jgi:single-stranded-DNA-specific exonuclease
MDGGRWTIRDCEPARTRALAQALGVTEITASVLLRRGHADVDEARAFLAGEREPHDPFLLGDMEAAVARIRLAAERGERICVHGDYDVDGICATALAVLTLRELGADVGWHLPSRFEEGYGVSSGTIARLAAEGYALVVTVDCGITAVDEVAQARSLGLDVIVTDHHRPGEARPDCPVVATRPSAYPFPELCGTGVVHKLAVALLGPDHPAVARHLDLVALATIADVVPLVDENRSLAAAGLRALARTRKPGLCALMRSAQVDPAAIDSTAVGFRLAPRINAAGRLCRPDVALHLLLTQDAGEAATLAQELEGLNRERQGVEERILRAAIAQVAEWPEARRRRRGYVLWSEDWHEGVIGIVASRLVERFHRPVVMIAGSSEGWKGSGRSIGVFDLHGALGACSEHLDRFGGHRAAAGLSLACESLEAFADAFAAHADACLTDEDLRPQTPVDAVVPASALTLDLAQELDRLAPFGLGNPDVTLLVAAVEAVDATTVGEGKHLRFRVRQRGRDGGSAIAFGLGSELDRIRGEERFDLAFRLKENRWNGVVSPQLVVRRLFPASAHYDALRDGFAELWRAGEQSWTPEARRVFAELGLLDSGAARRELLESETFRALLASAEMPLARAA